MYLYKKKVGIDFFFFIKMKIMVSVFFSEKTKVGSFWYMYLLSHGEPVQFCKGLRKE